MNRKFTTAVAALCILLLLAGCMPKQYRTSIRPGENYPEEYFPFYKQSVVFEFSGGAVMSARAGVRDGGADITGYYNDILDGAYVTESSDSIIKGFYKEYMFEIEVVQPSEEEAEAFGKVYTISLKQLSKALSANYTLPENYPGQSLPAYAGARIYEYAEDGGDFIFTAGSDDSADTIRQYYTALLGDTALDQESQEGGHVLSGYMEGYIYSIEIKEAQGDEAAAFKTIVKTFVQSAEMDFSSAPQPEWSLALEPEGDLDVSAVERTQGGYVLAGSLDGNAWAANISADGAVLWENTFGGSGFDAFSAVVPAGDGGFLAIGDTSSADGDVVGWHQGSIKSEATHDAWLVKFSATGNIEWQKAYGGSADEYAMGVVKTDSGYVIMATAGSEDGDVTGWHKAYSKSVPIEDIWVFMIDESGELKWQKAFGGSGDDRPKQILSAGDGGFIVCGETLSQDGDVVRGGRTDSSLDIWAVKLGAEGNIEWQSTLGGSGDDSFDSAAVSDDNSIYIAGSTHSGDGDVANFKGMSDYWVVRLSGDGGILWQSALGGSGFDNLDGMSVDKDGNMLISGWSYSSDGDKPEALGDADIWTVMLDNNGAVSWQKTLGGSRFDSALDISSSSGAGYTVVGYTSSVDGDIAGRVENEFGTPTYDYWLAGVDSNGELKWQQAYGGSANEHLELVLKTPDGFLLGGISYSEDIQGAKGVATPYYWVLKLKYGYAAKD